MTSIPDSVPLSMFSTDEIVDDLQRRCSACVVVLVRDLPSSKDPKRMAEVETMWTHGSRYACLGILQAAAARILSDGEEVEGEDEDAL